MRSHSGSHGYKFPEGFPFLRHKCVVTVYWPPSEKCHPVSFSFGLDARRMFYILAGKCIVRATAPSSLSVWEFALMNDLIVCQRWIRLKIFLRWKDYYLMRKALIWRWLQRTEGLVFVIWKSSRPKCPLINANWNCVGRSCGSLWAVNVCRSTQVTYGSTQIFALSELLWRFQMDWWFNSRWLNILSSFLQPGRASLSLS